MPMKGGIDCIGGSYDLFEDCKMADCPSESNRKLLFEGAKTGLPDFSWYNIPKRGKYTK
jgi:hypothetical protein